ncbi:hypothetical protein BDN72DRAFT_848537 [Pluteus cervinus]|uniref:Uncharacterized protein n=1 Tax=Pluteus cervinus TaxID=181527 RepID=A0ACD3ACI6_9AGAR|nr:hypothetical protein BDN72DRAFT_848537 [Pluteus cervinus]
MPSTPVCMGSLNFLSSPNQHICGIPPPLRTHLAHKTASVTTPHLLPPAAEPDHVYPAMSLISTSRDYTFSVTLPVVNRVAMITVSANRGDKLKVIADAWPMQNNCHYEWNIIFPPLDIDMLGVKAKFSPDGHLALNVPRLSRSMANCIC